MKERYAVSDSNVIKLAQPGAFADSLTEILRSGARALLTQAVEAEVAEFLAKHSDLKTETGRQRVVRHGHLPQREIMTGIGPVAVRQPRVRDREAAEGERIRYSPSIVPRYARRSQSLEVLIPILYLKGISTGDFEEALAALVGKDAPGLSASTIARLKEVWSEEHARWQKRDLSAKRYVYCWADGIHLEARLEEQAQCILVIIGATPEGKKEAVAALEAFVETYQIKYERAADCLTKDRDALLTFYDFPAEHWKHLRTTNPIESTFATVRHRTIRSKGCLSNKTALAMVFKLVEGAQKSWRRIDGHNQLPKLIQGVRFTDGIEVIGNSAAPQAQAAA